MSRNGITASEIVRTAMIEYFDKLDEKHALPLTPFGRFLDNLDKVPSGEKK